ncbi:hypothetical protein JNUCC1_01184 [Lentibacillus sp. JNUCC-1]|uniref:YwmB family TATA-box binding protein n=1 Tax=Lentibacillus sp. JNUCC-1 TaxID=2654513 RepID=UPI0012E98745|nr:YwmB family TATA-box binding protein [Lentibacillus sp. JNUCC-1]MUV37378.1 hypothetical protein [Lentibacillus sp. JNUCC-1]
MKQKMVFIFMILILFANSAAASTKADPLVDLAQFAQSYIAPVDTWEVTIKEHQSRSNLMTIVENARENGHKVTVTPSKKAVYYSWTNTDQKSGITTAFKVVEPTNDSFASELVAVISGSSWNDNIRQSYNQIRQNAQETYFMQDFVVFTCLTTQERDIINNVYVERKLQDRLDLTYISSQEDFIKDVHKKTTYGYTHLWATKIDMMDKPLNFQMVVRQGPNDGEQAVLGTPILIHEY